jgi:IS30 family transposase
MNPNFLIQIANKVYHISDVTEQTNKRDNVYARTAVSFFMRKEGMSLPAIGKFLNKDHSSIYFHLNKHEDQLKYNPMYKKLFSSFESELRRPINQEDFIKNEVKKIVLKLFDLKMTTEQIQEFWLECITIAKERKCQK